MGIYLNPGNENFKSMVSRKIYVDKTEMISVLNEFMDTDNKYVCISRPRRFGKTIAGEMLSAYYSRGCDSRELFLPYKIAGDPDFDSEGGRRNRQNVIKIDLNSEYQNTDEEPRLIRRLTGKIKGGAASGVHRIHGGGSGKPLRRKPNGLRGMQALV